MSDSFITYFHFLHITHFHVYSVARSHLNGSIWIRLRLEQLWKLWIILCYEQTFLNIHLFTIALHILRPPLSSKRLMQILHLIAIIPILRWIRFWICMPETNTHNQIISKNTCENEANGNFVNKTRSKTTHRLC